MLIAQLRIDIGSVGPVRQGLCEEGVVVFGIIVIMKRATSVLFLQTSKLIVSGVV